MANLAFSLCPYLFYKIWQKNLAEIVRFSSDSFAPFTMTIGMGILLLSISTSLPKIW